MTVKQRNLRKPAGNGKPPPGPPRSVTQNRSEGDGGQPKIRIDWRRIITRLMMIGGIMVAVYYTRANRLTPFVTQKEEVNKRSVDVTCSEDYAQELEQFKGCIPTKCGRVVWDNVVGPSEAAALLNIAQRGLALGGSGGGASILDLHSGALSQGSSFVNIYKLDSARIVFNTQDFKIYSHIKSKIHKAIAEHFGISGEGLYLTHPTFFSRITATPAKTIHDEYWHPHIDKETYESFHYTSLVYLTDYGQDFEGGRFIFVDKGSNKTVEPRRGRVSAFTSGSENLHYVERVKSGTRYAITVSFTCDPTHAISDPTLHS